MSDSFDLQIVNTIFTLINLYWGDLLFCFNLQPMHNFGSYSPISRELQLLHKFEECHTKNQRKINTPTNQTCTWL